MRLNHSSESKQIICTNYCHLAGFVPTDVFRSAGSTAACTNAEAGWHQHAVTDAVGVGTRAAVSLLPKQAAGEGSERRPQRVAPQPPITFYYEFTGGPQPAGVQVSEFASRSAQVSQPARRHPDLEELQVAEALDSRTLIYAPIIRLI